MPLCADSKMTDLLANLIFLVDIKVIIELSISILLCVCF